jgi:hypothetical protein
MANEKPPIQRLYDNLVRDNYDLPDYNTFSSDMQDSGKLQSLYKNISSEYDLPEFTVFQSDMIGGQKQQNEQFRSDPSSMKSQAISQGQKITNEVLPEKKLWNSLSDAPKEQWDAPVKEQDPLAPLTESMIPQDKIQSSVGEIDGGFNGYKKGLGEVEKMQKIASDNVAVERPVGEMDVEEIATKPLSFNSTIPLAVIPFGQDKQATQYLAKLMSVKPDQREMEKINSNLSEQEQSNLLFKGIDFESNQLEKDQSILAARGADLKYDQITKDFKQFQADKIASGAFAQKSQLKDQLTVKYAELVASGQMTKEQAEVSLDKEFNEQMQAQYKSLQEGLSADKEKNLIDYLEANSTGTAQLYSTQDIQDYKDYNNWIDANKKLNSAQRELVQKSQWVQEQIANKLYHNKVIEGNDPSISKFETFIQRSLDPFKASATAVIDNLVGLLDTTGGAGIGGIIGTLNPLVGGAIVANAISEKVTGKEFITGAKYGILDQSVDKLSNFVDSYIKDEYLRTYDKPLVDGTEGGAVKLNPYQMLPQTANAMTSMALLLGTAEMGGGTLKALGATEKVAQNAGLFASSFMQTKYAFKKEGMDAGMSEEGAEWFSTGQATVTSLLEMLSPNPSIRTALSSQAVKKAITTESAKELSFNGFLKGTLKVLSKEVPGEMTQEFLQDISSSVANGFINNTMSLKNNLQTADEKSILNTMITTAACAGLMTGGANTVNYQAQRSSNLVVAAENIETFKPILDGYLENKQIDKAKYDKIMGDVLKAKEVLNTMPPDLSLEKKSEVFAPIEQKKELEELIAKTDPVFSGALQVKIDKVNSEIQTALQDTPYSNVPVQKEVVDVEKGTIKNIRKIKSVDDFVEPDNSEIKNNNTFELIRGNVYENTDEIGQNKNIQGLTMNDAFPLISQAKAQLGTPVVTPEIATEKKPLTQNEEALKEIETEDMVLEDMVLEDMVLEDMVLEDMDETTENESYRTLNDAIPGPIKEGASNAELSDAKKAINDYWDENSRLIKKLGIPVSVFRMKQLNDADTVAKVNKWTESFTKSLEKFQGKKIRERLEKKGKKIEKKEKKLEVANKEKFLNKIAKLINPKTYEKSVNGIVRNKKITVEAMDSIKKFNKYGKLSREQIEEKLDRIQEKIEKQGEVTYEDKLELIALSIPSVLEKNSLQLENLYNSIKEFVSTGRKEQKALNKENAKQLNDLKKTLIRINDSRGNKTKTRDWMKNKEGLRPTYSRPNEAMARAESDLIGLTGTHENNERFYPGTKEEFENYLDEQSKNNGFTTDDLLNRKLDEKVIDILLYPYHSVVDFFVNVGNAWHNQLNKANFDVDRTAHEIFSEPIDKALIEESDIRIKMVNSWEDILTKLFGKTNYLPKGMYPVMKINDYTTKPVIDLMYKNRTKDIDSGAIKDTAKRLVLTRFQALNLFKLMQNEKVNNQLIEQGITPEIQEAVLNVVENDSKLLDLSSFMDDFFVEWYPEINKVYRELYHIDMPMEEFYFPMKRDGYSDPAFAEKIGSGNFSTNPVDVVAGNTKVRVGNKNNNIVKQRDVSEVMSDYIQTMSHFIAFGKAARDLSRVFGDKDVRGSIKLNNGAHALKTFDMFLDRFRKGNVEKTFTERWINKARSFAAIATLGMKLKQLITQPTSFVRHLDHPIQWLEGASKISDKDIKEFFSASTMQERLGAKSSIDMNTVSSEILRVSGKVNTLIDFIKAIGMLPTKGGDVIGIGIGEIPNYIYNKNQLKKEHPNWSYEEIKKEALEKSMTRVRRFNPSISVAHVTSAQASVIGKIYGMYKGDTSRMSAEVNDATRNIYRAYRKGGVKAIRKEDVSRLVLNRLLAPALFAFAANALRGIKADDDETILGFPKPIGIDDSPVDDMLYAMALGNMDANLILGDAIKSGVDTYRGDTFKQAMIPAPLKSPLQMINDISVVVSKDIFDASTKDYFNLLTSSATTIGVPVSTIKQIASGVKDASEGKASIGKLFGYTDYQIGNKKKKNKHSIVGGIRDLFDVNEENYPDAVKQFESEESDTEPQEKPEFKKGMTTNKNPKFGEWEVVLDLKNKPSHEEGGVDLDIKGNTVEAEGDELVLQNKDGDISIIPVKDRRKISELIKNNDYESVSEYVSKLNKYPKIAEDGGNYDNPPTAQEYIKFGIDPSSPTANDSLSYNRYIENIINYEKRGVLSQGVIDAEQKSLGFPQALSNLYNQKEGVELGDPITVETIKGQKFSYLTLPKGTVKPPVVTTVKKTPPQPTPIQIPASTSSVKEDYRSNDIPKLSKADVLNNVGIVNGKRMRYGVEVPEGYFD